MTSIAQDSIHGMRRAIDWKNAFFIAAGVPALVLFSMGAISATVGAPAWLELPAEVQGTLTNLMAQLIFEHADKSKTAVTREADHDL